VLLLGVGLLILVGSWLATRQRPLAAPDARVGSERRLDHPYGQPSSETCRG
jgi:hypothetical protein